MATDVRERTFLLFSLPTLVHPALSCELHGLLAPHAAIVAHTEFVSFTRAAHFGALAIPARASVCLAEVALRASNPGCTPRRELLLAHVGSIERSKTLLRVSKALLW